MNVSPETLAAIAAVLRSSVDNYKAVYPAETDDCMLPLLGLFLRFADIFEAAAEREREMSKGLSKKLDKNHDIPGNAAAMREALLNARTRFASLALMESEWRTCAESHVREIDAALAEPPRNCDVGTAEEQWDRFTEFCAFRPFCSNCPAKSLWNFEKGRKPSCGLIWAQMPYEEGGAE